MKLWPSLLLLLGLWLTACAGPVNPPHDGPPPANQPPVETAPSRGVWHTYAKVDRIYSLSMEDDTVWAATNAGLVRWNRADGLASHNLTSIAADKAGHIWVGTDGKGVSEFDGQTWRTYTAANGLADDSVLAIAVDGAGHKWFGTRGGLSEFDDKP
ncbi:MAG: hypothetical protein DPW09_31665 [Anaerolineae bacterium]|nr:hypothetical protein [Anaerolineales bacterium]MCQ3978007.1 hypothetical protein [Anaerolineae bacterium]